MSQPEAPLGNFDEDPISFGEAFGINPDGSPYEAPPEPEPEPEPDPTPEPEPVAGEEPTPSEEAGAGESAPEPEWKQRFQSDNELWKSYRELETKLSQTRPQEAAPALEQAPPPPVPLFKGETAEIKTEADLYNWATADPEAAAMFAMNNHERLTDEQMNNVMDNWVARQPWKASMAIQAWSVQMMREEIDERQAVQDRAYIENVKDTGIKQAIAELPMLETYREELGEYIEKNPKLEQMVEAARTPDELKSALHGIFYMMAGPKLAQQALEIQVQRQMEAKAAADAEAEAEQNGQRATTMTRNTAPPPSDSDNQDDAIRAKILNPGPRR